MSLAAQITLYDPRDRLAATLAELDATIERANKRYRFVGGDKYLDPDGTTVCRCLEAGARLIAEYHASIAAPLESSAGTRLEAIAELRGVLEAWEAASDEQWLASRQVHKPVELKPQRAGVKRGRG